MGKHYDQLTLEERCTIARLREAGQSIRQIAAALDRAPSTISRELKRNQGSQVGYKPGYAEEQAAPGAGKARAWNAMPSCATSFSAACNAAGRPSRSPAGSSARRSRPPSATRPSTASSTPRSAAPTTAPGATICPGPGTSAAGAPRPAVPRQLHKGRVSIACAPTPSSGAAPSAIGKPTSCTSPPPARPSSSRTNASPAFSCWPSNPARPPADRRPAPRLVPHPRPAPAQDHHLRQRHRVRPASPAHRPARHPYLLLRSPQPLAKRRRRKRHRTPAKTLAAQDKPRHHRRRILRALVVAYNNTPRKCLDFKSPAEAFHPNCCTSNVNPHPRCARDDSVSYRRKSRPEGRLSRRGAKRRTI